MNNIWMYWENSGREMPEFVRLCIETVYKHKGNATIQLLDQNSVFNHLPDLRPEWHKLTKAAHKADYVRTRLTYRYGGMWLDSDMAALSSLDPLFDFSVGFDFACQKISSAIGCFVARPGCKLLASIMSAQDDILNEIPLNFQWNGIGNDLLKRFGSDYEFHQWEKWTVDEIAGGKVSKLLSKQESIEKNIDQNAIVYHFCGNLLLPLLDKYARHQHKNVINENLLMSKILRKALERPEPNRVLRAFSLAELRDLGNSAIRKLTRQT